MSPDVASDAPAQQSPATFEFNKYVVRRAIFEEVEREAAVDGETKPTQMNAEITITATMAMIEGPRVRGQLMLETRVVPNPKWQPYRIDVAVSGVFSSNDATPAVMQQFCRANAPAILFPYIRQLIFELTSNAVGGPIQLHPVNLTGLAVQDWHTPDSNEPTTPSPSSETEQPSSR